MLKLDISDGFYCIVLAPNDIPKLGVVFPNHPNQEKLVALPLVLPMGWKNSPPVFSAATETATDMANTNLHNKTPTTFHPLESHAAALDQDPASISTDIPSSTSYLPAPTLQDSSLPSSSTPISYVDVFVDDFIAICQGENNKSHV
jgi:hypothetical protein